MLLSVGVSEGASEVVVDGVDELELDMVSVRLAHELRDGACGPVGEQISRR